MIAQIPACEAASIESGKGKKASDASTAPWARSAAFFIAISTELDLYLTKHYTKGHQHGFKKWTNDLQFRTACAR